MKFKHTVSEHTYHTTLYLDLDSIYVEGFIKPSVFEQAVKNILFEDFGEMGLLKKLYEAFGMFKNQNQQHDGLILTIVKFIQLC